MFCSKYPHYQLITFFTNLWRKNQSLFLVHFILRYFSQIIPLIITMSNLNTKHHKPSYLIKICLWITYSDPLIYTPMFFLTIHREKIQLKRSNLWIETNSTVIGYSDWDLCLIKLLLFLNVLREKEILISGWRTSTNSGFGWWVKLFIKSFELKNRIDSFANKLT